MKPVTARQRPDIVDAQAGQRLCCSHATKLGCLVTNARSKMSLKSEGSGMPTYSRSFDIVHNTPIDQLFILQIYFVTWINNRSTKHQETGS